MNKRRIFAGCLSFVVGMMIMACGTIGTAKHEPAEFRGITLSMDEIANDETGTVYPSDPFRKIDANAVLKLRFNVPLAPEALVGSEEWRAMDRILKEIDVLMKRYSELSLEAVAMPLTESVQMEAWHVKVRDFDKQFTAFTAMLKSPAMAAVISKEQINTLAVQSAIGERSFYELLAQHLVQKRKELYDKAEQIAKEGETYQVEVRGYLVPQIGEPYRLHIPGYDNIPSRNFQPIDRNGLIPTEAESKRLRAEYEGAKVVKSSLEEIAANKSVISNRIMELAEKLKIQIQSLLEDSQALWNNKDEEPIQQFMGELHNVDANQEKQLKTALDEFRKDIQLIKGLEQKVTNISKDTKQADALELLLNVQNLHDDIVSIVGDIDALVKRVQAWPERGKQLEKLTSAALKKMKEAKKEQVAQKAELVIQGFLNDFNQTGSALSKDLPATMTAFNYFIDDAFVKQGKDLMGTANILKPGEPGTIPRPLDNLEDAILDLRRSGITVGDTVEVDVGFIKKHSDELPEKTIQYSGQAVLAGLHRQFSGDIIFARAVSGTGSDEFKPNVGVSAEWHYYDRSSPNGFWNWIDPGIGFHAANLDQSPDQTVELGAGINASLWGGLLRVGYGWNLSVNRDRQYYYVGFGLFGLLNQLNNVKQINETKLK